jgi:hypothetical protein
VQVQTPAAGRALWSQIPGQTKGEVSERSKEAVLKTVEPQGSGGSNPSLSAIRRTAPFVIPRTPSFGGPKEASFGRLFRSVCRVIWDSFGEVREWPNRAPC